jgi:SAM-dependent methyltransferase
MLWIAQVSLDKEISLGCRWPNVASLPTASGASSITQSLPKRKNASLLSIFWGLTKTFLQVSVGLLTINFVVHFPYHTDVVRPPTATREAGNFYNKIYSDNDGPVADNAAEYVKLAQEAIAENHIVERVTGFAQTFGLDNKRVLDVGAGISASARSYFHKPFVQASATEMPFGDGEFDALWSIWVLEHVPKPEQALVEMRRVVKDGGLIYLRPAWNCVPWAAQGYPVRPFSDFGVQGKLIKASSLLMMSPIVRMAYILPDRVVRREYAKLSHAPTRLHYSLLEPNYSHYWMPDSDAVNDLDFYETMLWFTSRGDECLNCGPLALLQGEDLVIRVHKRSGI